MTAPMTPGDAPSLEKLDWRLGALEKKVDEGIQALRGDVQRLEYVRKDVYEEAKKTQDDRIVAVAGAAANAVKLAMWSVGLLATLILGGAITLLVTVATA